MNCKNCGAGYLSIEKSDTIKCSYCGTVDRNPLKEKSELIYDTSGGYNLIDFLATRNSMDFN